MTLTNSGVVSIPGQILQHLPTLNGAFGSKYGNDQAPHPVICKSIGHEPGRLSILVND